METLVTVLIVVAAASWISVRELPVLTGVLLQTKSLRLKWFKTSAVLVFAGAMLLPVARNLATQTVLSSDASVFSVPQIVTLASVALLYAALRAISNRSGIHLLVFASRMQPVAVVGIIFGLFAAGINQGALLSALAIPAGLRIFVAPLIAVVVITVLAEILVIRSDTMAERHFVLSLSAVFSIGFVAPAAMLLCSVPSICNIIGIQASPVSIPATICASLLGVSTVSRQMTIDLPHIFSIFAGLLLSPAIPLVVIYLIFTKFRVASTDSFITVTILSLLIIAGILTVSYIRAITRRRKEAERLLYAEQQEVYENQKALNTLEMKSVLSENQNLHRRVLCPGGSPPQGFFPQDG